MNQVSVIVPVYNAAPFLDRCIQSIINQTLRDWELILVDDASTDDSNAICREYEAQDERIRVCTMPINSGQSAARNMGLRRATGEFIAFVDADDYIDRRLLEQEVAAIADADVLCCGYRSIQNGQVTREVIATDRTVYRLTSACMKLFRSDFIRKNRLGFEQGHIFEDVIFSFDWWMANPRIRTASIVGYNYVENPNSAMHAHVLSEDTKPLFSMLQQRIKNHRGKCDMPMIWARTTIWKLRLYLATNRVVSAFSFDLFNPPTEENN